jgi:hypothetical protein
MCLLVVRFVKIDRGCNRLGPAYRILLTMRPRSELTAKSLLHKVAARYRLDLAIHSRILAALSNSRSFQLCICITMQVRWNSLVGESRDQKLAILHREVD